MYRALINWITYSFALAYPNVLPEHQQELLAQQPGASINDHLHFSSTIRDVLLQHQIITQVLDDFEPTYYLDIAYHKDHERVLLGNDIPVKAVAKRPTFTFHPISGPPSYGDRPSENNLTFTLILTDPDALSYEHPVKSEMCHWIMTNLTTPIGSTEVDWPGSSKSWDDLLDSVARTESMDPAQLEKKAGELEAYQPPGPPKKTGPHRYVFVLLEGDASNLHAPKERPHWGYGKERHGVRDWAKENNLTVVGANFFLAQHKKQ
ncbi:carboxypeptidase Y inhibitor [Lithohypha guttulata]|nr:carboxypeptidase Y inhibitor [Lithohypha guttulata]